MNSNTQRKPQTTWAERVRVTNSTTRYTLDPLPRCTEGNTIKILDESFMEGVDQWTRCMVGFFPGVRLPFHVVNTIATKTWRHSGLEHVMATSNGFFLFRFKSETELQEVLGKGPWMFGGKSIVLQQWHPHFCFDKNKISKLPVWLRLRGLPFPLWTKQGLSQAATMVGKPLACDEYTHNCTKLDYARICVEVDATLPYVHQFEIDCTLSDTPIQIEVEYEWRPRRCEKCKVFGHSCKEIQVEPHPTGHLEVQATTEVEIPLPNQTLIPPPTDTIPNPAAKQPTQQPQNPNIDQPQINQPQLKQPTKQQQNPKPTSPKETKVKILTQAALPRRKQLRGRNQ
ncbi:hypothetical protein OIU76_026572 [Salix suchowensis]|nr:hypothetical protein OIU76_026572 [Salix suchowensis]